MKADCHIESGNPAQSYPEAFKFVTAANIWGCNKYNFKASKKKHNDFSITESGLVINPRWPNIVILVHHQSCNCHGVGVLEIKHPYCHTL